MEDFNQVMMDQLLELGFQLGEPPEFFPLVNPDWWWRGFDGDRRASVPAFQGYFVHDFALDDRDLAEGLPDHSVWRGDFVRIVVPMAYYSHVRQVTITATNNLLNIEAPVFLI